MAGLSRYTAVLRLFSQAQSEWTVQDMAERLGVPQSTVYRTCLLYTSPSPRD